MIRISITRIRDLHRRVYKSCLRSFESATCIERGVAIIEEFNWAITYDEEQKQYLLLVMNPMAYERVRVVMGNPTCDLDSAVCALVEGYRLYREKLESSDDKSTVAVFAVMNVTEREFRIKTEVVWFLGENGITAGSLTFRNQIDLGGLANAEKLELTLVDHHVMSSNSSEELVNSVVEIIDHRPRDSIWSWPAKVKITLESVGSCASLVANRLLAEKPELLDARIRALLRGTILLDTHNLSLEAGRAVALDREMIARLEVLEQRRNEEESLRARDEIYRQILAAKTDISGLTVDDMLAKDLKVIEDVAIPVFPILVKEFIKWPGALERVASFAAEASFSLVLLLGIDLKGEGMKRDLGIWALVASKELDEMVSRLRDSDLELEEAGSEVELPKAGGRFVLFEQRNVRLTRKYVIPIVRSTMLGHRCEKR